MFGCCWRLHFSSQWWVKTPQKAQNSTKRLQINLKPWIQLGYIFTNLDNVTNFTLSISFLSCVTMGSSKIIVFARERKKVQSVFNMLEKIANFCKYIFCVSRRRTSTIDIMRLILPNKTFIFSWFQCAF